MTYGLLRASWVFATLLALSVLVRAKVGLPLARGMAPAAPGRWQLLSLMAGYDTAGPPDDFMFDGRQWWLQRWLRPDGATVEQDDTVAQRALDVVTSGYSGPLCQSVLLADARRRYRLLLWRWQCDKETWRRLTLAIRYGDSIVSTGSADIPG